jgi:transposase, IS5 family
LGDDAVPDETTILRFRHLLEQHKLTGAMFEAISAIPLKHRLCLLSSLVQLS